LMAAWAIVARNVVSAKANKNWLLCIPQLHEMDWRLYMHFEDRRGSLNEPNPNRLNKHSMNECQELDRGATKSRPIPTTRLLV
jgi:hypothetical protein